VAFAGAMPLLAALAVVAWLGALLPGAHLEARRSGLPSAFFAAFLAEAAPRCGPPPDSTCEARESWRVYSSMVVDGRAAWGRGRPAASALPFIWERVIVLKAGLELGAGALAIHVAPSPCMPCSPVSGTVAHPLAVACAPATLTCLCCSADGIGRVVVRNKDKCAGARCEGLWRRHASWWACPRQALINQRALIQHRAAHR